MYDKLIVKGPINIDIRKKVKMNTTKLFVTDNLLKLDNIKIYD